MIFESLFVLWHFISIYSTYLISEVIKNTYIYLNFALVGHQIHWNQDISKIKHNNYLNIFLIRTPLCTEYLHCFISLNTVRISAYPVKIVCVVMGYVVQFFGLLWYDFVRSLAFYLARRRKMPDFDLLANFCFHCYQCLYCYRWMV